MLRYFVLASFALWNYLAVAQNNSLVVNGAYIKISNGTATRPAYMVVNQASASGIVRTSGHIISEGEFNFVKWNIGNTITGLFTVPFGYNNKEYLPLSFSKTSGTGTGSFIFSTYRTATWQNSLYLPAGITDFTNASGADNSAKVIDRFWKIDATGYTAKPDLTDLTFTYADVEYTVASNTIDESDLMAQRWNSTLSKWDDFIPVGSVNTASNTFAIPSLAADNLFQWWTLTSSASPLPVEFSEFTAHKIDDYIQLTWITSSELNNAVFEIERSTDGILFEKIGEVQGSGTKHQSTSYFFNDGHFPLQENVYYRIRQVDTNGDYEYSKIKVIHSQSHKLSIDFSVYPNPLQNEEVLHIKSLSTNLNATDELVIKLYNNNGVEIFERRELLSSTGVEILEPFNTLSAGIYLLQLNYSTKIYQFRIVKL